MYSPDLVVEAYLNSDWQNITSYVRTGSAVQITRGRKNEASQADPQQCNLTLDNTDGRFTPRNPMGAYFGSIGRNTPIRVALRSAKDAFGRTVSSAWGTLDAGGSWNVGLGAGSPVNFSDWNVGSGVATHSVPTTAAYRISFLDVVQFADVDVAASFSLTQSSITGGDVEPTLILRAGSNTDYYMARVTVNGTTVKLALLHNDGTTIAPAATIPGLTYAANTKFRVRAQIEGTTLRAKVWQASTAEPLGWHVSGIDIATRTYRTGEVGIRSGVATGNTNTKPIVFSWDDFEVRSMRFAGEVAEWPNTYSLSAKDLTAPITASGITRRIGSSSSPLRPTLDRYLATQAPTLWWPLEDGKNATQGAPAVGLAPAVFQLNSLGNGTIAWANDTTLPGTLQAPQLTKGGSLYCSTSADLGGTSWHVSWQQKSTAAGGAQVLIGTYSTAILLLTTFNDGSLELDLTTGNPLSPTVLITAGAPAVSLYDGQWWTFGLSAEQSGGNTNWTLWLNGSIVGTATSTSFTLRSLASVLLQSPNSTAPVEFAHLAIWNSVPSNTVVQTIRTAATGYASELVGSRIVRLCGEQGLDLVVDGDWTNTQAMGPQLPGNLVDLLRDCAKVDMGTLFEPRATAAIGYRVMQAKCNQAATVTAASTNLGAPIQPLDDDSLTVNDVVVTRVNGASYEASLATGRLSTAAPGAGGVGKYEKSYTLNCYTDLQLPALAGWLLTLGTVDQARYPTLTFLREGVSATLAAALLLADLDAKLVVTAPHAYGIYDDIQQLISGYTETIASDGHRIVFNCVPEEPYHVGVLDDGGVSRVDSAASYVNTAFNTTVTSVVIKTTDGTLWTTDAAEFPFDVIVGGERMTVTNITGSSSPQTFTVTRSVNSVVKSHAVDEPVTLFRPCYIGLG